MAELVIHTRSFHPLESFGAGGLFYEGDNRDFTTALGVTSRIRNRVVIDLPSARVTEHTTISDPSSNRTVPLVELHQDYQDEDLQPTATLSQQIDPYRADGDQHVRILVTYRGQNFAMPKVNDKEWREMYKKRVPDLDVTHSLNITIDRGTKKLTFASRIVGDGFPNTESFLMDTGETNAVFLGVHRRIGSATGQLVGNRRIAMTAGSAKVDYPGDTLGSALDAYFAQDYATHLGSMIDLFAEFGRKPTNRADWNKMHTAHDAKGGKVRRWWLDNDVVWIPGRPGSSLP